MEPPIQECFGQNQSLYDSVYPVSYGPDTLKSYSGANKYVMHFNKGDFSYSLLALLPVFPHSPRLHNTRQIIYPANLVLKTHDTICLLAVKPVKRYRKGELKRDAI
jgi:hypothetical protein